MAVERFDLPDDQWAELDYRPTHGLIRKIGRETARAGRDDPLAGEDIIVLNLVREWSVKDDTGESVPLKRDSFDRIPQTTFSLLAEECLRIVESAYPNPRAR